MSEDTVLHVGYLEGHMFKFTVSYNLSCVNCHSAMIEFIKFHLRVFLEDGELESMTQSRVSHRKWVG